MHWQLASCSFCSRFFLSHEKSPSILVKAWAWKFLQPSAQVMWPRLQTGVVANPCHSAAPHVCAVASGAGMRRAQSISCMTQLQAKAAVTDPDVGGHFTRRCVGSLLSVDLSNVPSRAFVKPEYCCTERQYPLQALSVSKLRLQTADCFHFPIWSPLLCQAGGLEGRMSDHCCRCPVACGEKAHWLQSTGRTRNDHYVSIADTG